MEGRLGSRNPVDGEDLPRSSNYIPKTTAGSAEVLPAAGQAGLSISTSTGPDGSKKTQPIAFIFDLLLVKVPPEHKLSIFRLFLPLLKPKGEKNSHEMQRAPDTPPQAPSSELDDLPLPHAQAWDRHGCRAQAAIPVAAPASLHTDGNGTSPSAAGSICCCCPHRRRCLERRTRNNWLHKPRLSPTQAKSFNPKLPGTAERLNASPLFSGRNDISRAMKWT